MSLRFGYNSNGFAHHRLEDAIDVLAGLGYDGVALTLDWHHLDPLAASPEQVARVAARLRSAGLGVTVETGARYLLDPWRKHEPTLVSRQGRARRIDFLKKAIEVAAALSAEAVAFFSGRLAADVDTADARGWLAEGCHALARHAEAHGVVLALEPEPGMLVQTLDDALGVIRAVGSDHLRIALDVGHVRCSERLAEAEAIAAYGPWVRTVHIEDIAGRVHEHRMFGEGDLAFEPILAALTALPFPGLVSVELSRDSHRAPEVARAALAFLRARLPGALAVSEGRSS